MLVLPTYHPVHVAHQVATLDQLSAGRAILGVGLGPADAAAVPLLHSVLEDAGRDPGSFPISKRVFMSVHERGDIARSEVDHWFSGVYHNPTGTDQFGVFGTPDQVRRQLEALAETGATHLLLNPVTRFAEQLEVLAEIVGLRAR